MLDEIKELYAQIYEKTKFISLVAANLGKQPRSLRNHWFGSFWAIPADYQPKVVELLKKTIKQQYE